MVGKVDAHQHVNALYERVKDDPRIEALGCSEVLSKAKETRDALTKLHKEVDRWPPAEFAKKKLGAEGAIEKFKEAFQTLMDYESSIQIANGEKGMEESKHKRQVRTRNQNTIKELNTATRAPCPEQFARYIADFVERFRSNRYGAYVASDAQSSSTDATGIFNGKDFSKPAYMFEHSKEKTYWDQALAKLLSILSTQFLPKTTTVESIFEKDEKGKRLCLVGALEQIEWFPNDPDASPVFNLKGDLCGTVVCQRLYRCVTDIAAMPYAGLSCFISIVQGLVWISCIPVESLLTHQKGILNIEDYLNDVDIQWTTKNVISANAPAGTNVYVPFGYVPIIIAMPSAENLEEHAAAWVMNAILDDTAMLASSVPVRAEVKSWVSKGFAVGLHSLAPNREAIETWMEAWPKEHVAKLKPETINIDGEYDGA